MIVYFADRKLNILGQASTSLPGGLIITDDTKTEDVETGVAIFECTIGFDSESRAAVESYVEVGNYILRKHDNENEFYTIIDSELDTKKRTVYLYAEDAGLDLLNEIVGEYEADQAYPMTHYVEEFAYDSGFVMGINETAGMTRQLRFTDEETVTSRLANIAAQFDGCEISYSYDIKNLHITNKYINIYKRRGKDIGTTLWLNKDIDNIVIRKTVANVATALRCTGSTPPQEDSPIGLRGYSYDDGDIHIDGDVLKSRSALKKWSRYINPNEQNLYPGHEGHIVRLFSYDTTSQAILCTEAIRELKRVCEMEANYEADIRSLPENTKIGDRVNIVDEAGKLFLSTRLLKLETSVVNREEKAVLGEFFMKESGIKEKVRELAYQYAANAQSSARALSVANRAKEVAETAQEQADTALADAESAHQAATAATMAANMATQSAQTAQAVADNAQAIVVGVERSVAGLEVSVSSARAAAEQARQAADTAQTNATEAKAAASNAAEKADAASAAVGPAQEAAENAVEIAKEAKTGVRQAMADADSAAAIAAAAKQDAEAFRADIDSLAENLTTLENTMVADYTRKTELTKATASLQSQVTQNAGQIQSTATQLQTVDETANSARNQAQLAQQAATAAQETANAAKAEAIEAQSAADSANAAAQAAQTEADTASAAAATAKNVAEQAEAALEAAQAELETVTLRVDTTEEDIAAAQKAVENAQLAALQAHSDALSAAQTATTAREAADTAVSNAAAAREMANDAAAKATNAQSVADSAAGEAAAAKATASEAVTTAQAAQQTASTAKEEAGAAQLAAEEAARTAANAKSVADDADAKAAQAAAELSAAQQNLENVSSRVDATEEEVAAARQAVSTAQAAADKAKQDAQAAQAAADTAQSTAATAQAAANNAKAAANQAQADAQAAQEAADKAQADVDSLAVRVTTAETKLTQNSDQISLMATRQEVTQAFSGYYTKEDIDTLREAAEQATREGLDLVQTTVERSISSLAVKNDEITAGVKQVEEKFTESLTAVNENVSSLTKEVAAKMSAEAVEMQIQTAMETGASRVITSTGFSFDAHGLTVEKTDSEMRTQITEDGMTVFQEASAVLTANNQGVDAKNLHATTYLLVGGRSRFENYGEARTGCFWIGG